MAYGAVSVGTTATAIPMPTARVTLVDNGSVTVYFGTDASVTTSTGAPVLAGGGSATFEYPVWGITASGTADVRWISSG